MSGLNLFSFLTLLEITEGISKACLLAQVVLRKELGVAILAVVVRVWPRLVHLRKFEATASVGTHDRSHRALSQDMLLQLLVLDDDFATIVDASESHVLAEVLQAVTLKRF